MEENDLIKKVELIKTQCEQEEYFIDRYIKGYEIIDQKTKDRYRFIITKSLETVIETNDTAYRSAILVTLAKLFSKGWEFETAAKIIEGIELSSKKKAANEALSNSRSEYIESLSNREISQARAENLRTQLLNIPEVIRLMDKIISGNEIGKRKSYRTTSDQPKSYEKKSYQEYEQKNNDEDLKGDVSGKEKAEHQNQETETKKEQAAQNEQILHKKITFPNEYIWFALIGLALAGSIGWQIYQDHESTQNYIDNQNIDGGRTKLDISENKTNYNDYTNHRVGNLNEGQLANCKAPTIICQMVADQNQTRSEKKQDIFIPKKTIGDEAAIKDETQQNSNPYSDAENSFKALEDKSKIDLQLKLLAAGYLTSLPNKKFSKRLYDAICRFQRDHNRSACSEISQDDVDTLTNETRSLFQLWGLQKTDIPPLGLRLLIPASSGIGIKPTPIDGGITFTDNDQKLALSYQTFQFNDISVLFDKLTQEAESRGETVEYKVKKDMFFAFKSRDNGYNNNTFARFHLYQDKLIGFIFTWKNDGPPLYLERLANILSSSLYAEITHGIELEFPYISIITPKTAVIPSEYDTERNRNSTGESKGLQPETSKLSNNDDTRFESGLVETVPVEIEGGVYLVWININDQIVQPAIVDSGAADVTIPQGVYTSLIRSRTITENDIIGVSKYVLADGSKVESLVIRIRKMKIGNVILNDIKASITNDKASILLGQSFLSRFKSWSIDNSRKVLILKR